MHAAYLVSTFFLFFPPSFSQKCYYPSGRESTDVPCDSSADASPCCATGFECLSNRLCVYGSNTSEATFHRGSCTDSSWTSSECPNFCRSDSSTYYLDGGNTLSVCGDGSTVGLFCCDSKDEINGGGTCCSNSSDVLTLGAGDIETTIGVSATASTSSRTSTTPATLVATTADTSIRSTTAATTAATSNSSNSSESSTNTTALGVGIGVGVGGAAVAMLLLVYLYRRRSRTRKAAGGHTFAEYNAELEGPAPTSSAVVKPHMSELDGTHSLIELDGNSPGREASPISFRK